jgi:hypothetical protein
LSAGVHIIEERPLRGEFKNEIGKIRILEELIKCRDEGLFEPFQEGNLMHKACPLVRRGQ